VLFILGLGMGAVATYVVRWSQQPSPDEPAVPTWSGAYTARGSMGSSTPRGEISRELRISSRGGLRRMELPSGEVMVDTGEWVVALRDPDRSEVICPSYTGLDESSLGSRYQVDTEPGSPIAGRPTRLVRVTDTQTGAPALELWRDAETGVPLARQSYFHDGDLASWSRIDEIDYTAEPPPIEHVLVDGSDIGGLPMNPYEFRQRANFAPAPPGYVPDGYQEVGLFCHQCEHGRAYAEFRYTDGLRILSVYQRNPRKEPSGRAQGRGRGMGRGRGAARGEEGAHIGRVQDLDLGIAHAARQRRGGRVVIVIGDLPAKDARRVLESVPAEE
jgi:negative regulator of sigma E activity